jgi:hypothetical protein
MKLRTLMLGATFSLAAVSGLAQADDQTAAVKPVPYHYGLPMNIDKVLYQVSVQGSHGVRRELSEDVRCLRFPELKRTTVGPSLLTKHLKRH